ncbi:hypothetical protein AVEN_252668-1 [Araneus ventricosus]|uniref:Uncharacterized protein n=1 Tax=Araneus ventricosus TaxID=182803 RepID=A0A4Y2LHT4_ARAVE|nr:hypothetical protein AVEN_252668-1 [Araneus ventricosus]
MSDFAASFEVPPGADHSSPLPFSYGTGGNRDVPCFILTAIVTGFVETFVYVSPYPTTITDLKVRIITGIAIIDSSGVAKGGARGMDARGRSGVRVRPMRGRTCGTMVGE